MNETKHREQSEGRKKPNPLVVAVSRAWFVTIEQFSEENELYDEEWQAGIDVYFFYTRDKQRIRVGACVECATFDHLVDENGYDDGVF